MRLFKKSKTAAQVQLRRENTHPFSVLDGYVPLKKSETTLYRSLREALPVVDAAVLKMIRLTGGFTAASSDRLADSALKDFIRTVSVGRGQTGLNRFLECYLDSMITCGCAVGEIVLDNRRRIAAVLCGSLDNLEIREGTSPLDFEICRRDGVGCAEPLPKQGLLLFTPFNPEADSPYGVSMLRSMPFLGGILLKIYNSVGVNWERAGNVRYAVTYRPQGDMVDRAFAAERSAQLAEEWSNAMRETRSGHIRDFVAVGDVDIRVIGADGQILDSEVPVRQILEQLIARTGIPPFMLGLNWSSTERMSSQQADMLTSEITAIRRSLSPMLERICRTFLRSEGIAADFEIIWDDINLQDEVEEAHAALYLAQAEKIKEDSIGDK